MSQKKRNEEKGGRGTSARKAPGAGCTCSSHSNTREARSNPNGLPSPSVPPFAEFFKELAIERQNLLDALRYTLREYDRAMGSVQLGHGWTAADILKLQKIRAMAYGDMAKVDI